MAVGTGGSPAPPPPQYFANQKNSRVEKITAYNSVYSNKVKIGS